MTYLETYAVMCVQHNYSLCNCLEICLDGDVRIAGGESSLIGRVEVCVNSTWGIVCGNDWIDLNALVVCQQIGHSPNGTNNLAGHS